MPHGTKIATCCYCGTRAALVLKGKVSHELACASCGAPLHDLKMLRVDAMDITAFSRKAPKRKAEPRSVIPKPVWKQKRKRPKKVKKRRKSMAKRFFDEAFDVIEDIFD